MRHWHRQALLEGSVYSISGIFLAGYVFNIGFESLTSLLVAEYFASILATVGWFVWFRDEKSGGK